MFSYALAKGGRQKNNRSSVNWVFVLLLLSFFGAGCRQNPPAESRFYENESRPVPKLMIETPIRDKYPWEGKKSSIDTLPERLTDTQKKLNSETELLDKIIHGKRLTKE